PRVTVSSPENLIRSLEMMPTWRIDTFSVEPKPAHENVAWRVLSRCVARKNASGWIEVWGTRIPCSETVGTGVWVAMVSGSSLVGERDEAGQPQLGPAIGDELRGEVGEDRHPAHREPETQPAAGHQAFDAA